jgi:hypothetical protein
VRLTINTFDSLGPIWHSSGVLCISHPRVPRHSFHWPRSFTGLPSSGHRAYYAYIPSVIHLSLGFCDADRTILPKSKTIQFSPTGFCALGVKVAKDRSLGSFTPSTSASARNHFFRLRIWFRSTQHHLCTTSAPATSQGPTPMVLHERSNLVVGLSTEFILSVMWRC